MAYEGSVELISGIKQANNGTFPLVDASAVRVTDSKRLDAALTDLNDGKANVSSLTDKVNKANAEFSGPVSMGRKEGTTVGQNSVAIGYNVEASELYTHAEGAATKATAYYAHAEGSETTASGERSHAEGSNTIASGTASHAEGRSTVASNIYSHAEGLSSKATGSYSHAEGSSESHGTYSHAEGYDTKTNGEYSHSEGKGTIANGWYSHAAGMYNIPSSGVWSRSGMTSEYESDHAYVYGDFAYIREVTQDSQYHYTYYVCIENHTSGSTIDLSKWYVIYDRVSVLDQLPDFWYWPEAEIIGNGLNADNRANARVLSWTGDEFLRGDLYIHCDTDSSNGKKVATQEYVEALEARIAALEAAIQNS